MDFFLTKPINFHELRSLLDGMEFDDTCCEVELQSLAILNKEEALQRAAGEEEVLLEIMEVFREDVPRKIQQLREVIEEEDVRGLQRTAHIVKGATGAIGAKRCWNAANRLEKAALSKNMPAIPVLMIDLEKELAALLERMDVLRSELASVVENKPAQ